MGGGGSIESQNIPDPNFQNEKRTLKQGYGFQTNQLNQYVQGQPLLQTAQTGALNNYGGLGGLTAPISALSAQLPGFFGGLQNQVGGLQQDLSGYSNQLGSLLPQISGYQQQGQGLFGQLGGLSSRLGGIYGAPGGPAGIIASGGAVTDPDILRAEAQRSLSDQERAGVAHTRGGLSQSILNRGQWREGRLAQAQQVGQQLTQGQAGLAGQQGGILGLLGQLTGQKAGIVGQRAGITGQQAGLTGLQAGLFGQQGALATQLPAAIQGLQTGGLNQLLGAQGANVSAFAGTQNPILNYISNFYGREQQGRIAEATLNQQGQAANAAGDAGKSSGLMSAGGAIAGGALIAL